MPTVRVELSPGRTHEQKAQYVEQVTRLTSEVLNCPVDSVDVMFVEIAPYEWARAGKFFGKAPAADGQ